MHIYLHYFYNENDGQEDSFITHLLDGHQMLLDTSPQFLSSYFFLHTVARYIRAETCMFMIKLPQYSSQEMMMERLRYAIHCREDPLSG